MALGWRMAGVIVLLLCLTWKLAETKQPLPVLQVSNSLCEDGLVNLDSIPHPEDCGDVCVASGDPHFSTFDCVRYEYHGKCNYTLVKNCGGELANFEVIGELHRLQYHQRLSVIKSLLIKGEGKTIEMDSSFKVSIDGIQMNSENTQVLTFATIQRYCNAVVVNMTNGIKIFWSHPFRVMIVIEPGATEALSGNLCGLCGNNNDIKFDDFTTRDNELVSDVVGFGDSWRTDSNCDVCGDCDHTLCQSNPHNYEQAQDICSLLNGTLPECGGDGFLQAIHKGCVELLCATFPETDGLCHLLDIYIKVCEGNGTEVNVVALPDDCNVDPCQPNPCQNDGNCISVNSNEFECICVDDYWGPVCENPPPCNSNPCQNGGTCVNNGENYRCVCPFGVWGGPTCTIRCYVCWACGDPHLYTFDGTWYDFQGKCMYTLARSTADFPNQFEVVGNNIEAFWNRRVSITREIYVIIDYGDYGVWTFSFRYGYGGIVVNEETVSLPYTNTDAEGNTRVHIHQAGSYTLLSTNFGLYVVWNGVHCVCIVVPEFFINNVVGLCGLFNGNKADDWTKPDNETVTNANEFGNSWVYEKLEACPEACTAETCSSNPCEENPDRRPLARALCTYLDSSGNNTGPFHGCFNVTNPNQHLANCMYDICAGQSHDSICDDMANYVFDCRAAGGHIPANWRNSVPACAIKCDEGMEHSDCGHGGTGCPPTCANPAAPVTCNVQCLEGCHCKEGLLWTPGRCVSPEHCGCTRNGVYYAQNTEFVTENCSQRCTCRTGNKLECVDYGPCGENAECTIRNGKRGCYCLNGYNGDGFDCNAWYTCRVCGDPHYDMLDGTRYDFQGRCRYTLVKTVSGDIAFEIIAKNRPWNRNPRTSLTRQLFITVYNLTVEFGFGNAVLVNGEVVNLPFSRDDQLIIYKSCRYTVLVAEYGLQIIWDGYTCVKIRLPDSFMTKVLGLCGFFNGKSSDDFLDPQFNLIDNVNDFGNSWKYGADEDCDCPPEICTDVHPCVKNPGASELCIPLEDTESPFAACFETVDPKPYFENCAYDACAAENGTDIVCEHFERYVSECREARVAINGWRKVFTQCVIKCREGMRYTDCGKPCQPNCANPYVNQCPQQTCVQGCECLPGLVVSGDECVQPNQCGCQYNGRYYKPMERFTTSDCGSKCLCIGNRQVECDPLRCGNNAVCDIRDGVRGCYCNEGFILMTDGRTCEPSSPCVPNPCQNGGQCVETANMTSYVCRCPFGQWTGPTCSTRYYQCYACGDPHYRTLDGKYYDFQGRCKYTLMKSLPNATHQFEAVANNIGWRGSRVTVTRVVYLYFSFKGVQYEICFKYTLTNILVNKVATNLPFYLKNDDGSTHLVVQKIGYNTVLLTDFGLIISWNGRHCVRLYLAETFLSSVAGLCGFFNGDVTDDFTNSDFNVQSNPNVFGNSWVYGECSTPCTPRTCPVDPCGGDAEAIMKARDLCQPLDPKNSFSVFAKCFGVVNPQTFFDNCVFDMCVDSDDEVRCEHFNLYATACRGHGDAGVEIGKWRASIEACAIECVENMEYQYCGTACRATCLQGPSDECKIPCVEGCQCVAGYVWNNDRCVLKGQCGCTNNGRYYQVGETIVSNNCREQCTCETGGDLNCRRLEECSQNEVCEIRNGKRGCYCPAGFFVSSDGVCQRRFSCRACGDPHYETLDGVRYDFMGTCSYILAKSSESAQGEFLVVGDNIPWARNPRATVTRFVHIYVYNLTVQFSWNTAAVLINDQIVNLPYNLENHLTVYSSGIYTILETDFGLQVYWDGHWCVYVKVPAMFLNHVDGLCGHLSQNRSDEFTNPDGKIETDINAFGNSWTYGTDCPPCETCLTGSPCDEDPDAAEIADSVCSPLTDGCREDHTTTTYAYKYDWPKIPVNTTTFTFKVRAKNDAHVALSPRPNDVAKLIEIVLGGWGNQQSVIRHCKQCSALTTASTPNLLSRVEYREFYISFADGLVQVGKVGQNAFMSYQFDKPNINYIGISTGWGSDGDWKFCGYDPNPPFGACLDVVDPSDLLRDCRFDICADPENEAESCSYLQQYADKCRAKGVKVNGWRNAVPHCAIECAEFKEYLDCGTACPATCANPSAPEMCNDVCVQGCQCLPGLLASGNTCVTKDECGCTSNGKYYTNGEQFIDDDCKFRLTCKSGKLSSEDISCDDHAVCEIQNGARGCFCRGTYVGNGFTCNTPCEQDPHPCQNGAECIDATNDDGYLCRCPEGRSGPRCTERLLLCQASGDPHYVGLDGRKFDFQGDCEYVLTTNCSSDLPAFTVIVDNVRSRRNSRVSLTRTVTVTVFGQTIFLGRHKVVQINNGGAAILPVSHPNYNIYLSGSYVIVKTDFNLIVEWNGYSTVKVKVPVKFGGNLCGLCGNGNGDQSDDMVKRNGDTETNINVWGHSWANQKECQLCKDCPTGNVCDVADDDVVDDANEYCKIITAKTGIFQRESEPEEPSERTRPPGLFRPESKRSLRYPMMTARHVSEELSHVTGFSTSIGTSSRGFDRLRIKRQAPGLVGVQRIQLRWSATGRRSDVKYSVTVNASVSFYEQSANIRGTGLWKLSMYGSNNVDGTGKQFQRFDQLLSAIHQAQPLVGGADILFANARGAIDITNIGCNLEFRYLCFDFMKGDHPEPDFLFLTFQTNQTKFTLCSDRCSEETGPPPVRVTGLEVRLAAFGIQPDVRDSFVVNSTVQFSSTSPDVTGRGLWKLSIYGSQTNDGRGNHFQRIDQVLSESQQAQPLQGGTDIFFAESPGKIDIHSIGCGQYQFICFDFTKGDNSSSRFNFKTVQTQSHKYTLCFQRECEEDMGMDITAGFVIITDLLAPAIKIAPLDTLNFQPIPLQGLRRPVAVDFDPVDQMMYWTDVFANTISRCYLDGSGREIVLHLGSKSVADGLSIDVISRLLYWTDTGYDTIEKSNLDGSVRSVVINMGSLEPRAIIVDSSNGRLFWTGWGATPKIERSNVDGSDRVALIDTDLLLPNGLAVDFLGGRMYWCDGGLDRIESSDLDGGNRRLLYNGIVKNIYPFDIGMYHDTIFWTDWEVSRLYAMNLSDVNPIVINGSDVFTRPTGLHIHYGGCTKDDGTFVSEGRTYVDRCVSCTCLNQVLTCADIACPRPDVVKGITCTAVTVEGRCCPEYQCNKTGCVDGDGNVVPDGWTTGGPCSPCTCHRGELRCIAYRCALPEPPLGENCTLVTQEGECCPSWICQPGEGPFVNCHDAIDASKYFNDCTYDWCATQSHLQVCEDIAAYAEACQLQGIQIGNWRDGLKCALECPEYSHYELCPSACQARCSALNAGDDPCSEYCHEGCVCDEDYVLEGDHCKRVEDCGCVDTSGYYHLQNTTKISDTCDEACVCEGPERIPENNGWNCQRHKCGVNADCDVRNGIRSCYCKEGFILNGEICQNGEERRDIP